MPNLTSLTIDEALEALMFNSSVPLACPRRSPHSCSRRCSQLGDDDNGSWAPKTLGTGLLLHFCTLLPTKHQNTMVPDGNSSLAH